MGTGEIDLADDFALGAPSDIHDHEVLLRNAPQINPLSWVGILHPVPAIPRMMNNPFLLEIFQDLLETLPPEALPILEGELECRTLYVAYEDEQVVGVDEAMFGRPPKKIVRVLHQELIQG